MTKQTHLRSPGDLPITVVSFILTILMGVAFIFSFPLLSKRGTGEKMDAYFDYGVGQAFSIESVTWLVLSAFTLWLGLYSFNYRRWGKANQEKNSSKRAMMEENNHRDHKIISGTLFVYSLLPLGLLLFWWLTDVAPSNYEYSTLEDGTTYIISSLLPVGSAIGFATYFIKTFKKPDSNKRDIEK